MDINTKKNINKTVKFILFLRITPCIMQKDSNTLHGIVSFRDHKSRNNVDELSRYALIKSKDKGITWQGTEFNKHRWLRSASGIPIKGICPNLTKVEDGYILMGYDESTSKNASWFSEDGGTWKKNKICNYVEEVFND